MKIAAVQIRPVAGDVNTNIIRHLELIDIATNQGADLIYFPELSVTGYEPNMARSLAMFVSSTCFDAFQESSDTNNITIGIGAPLLNKNNIHIGMIWFEPNKPRSSYSKQLLHTDEDSVFTPGSSQLILQKGGYQFAPAICYESTQISHSNAAVDLGAEIYLASVATSVTGIDKEIQHYSKIAKTKKLFVVLANCIGPCDDFIGVGKSGAWDTNGQLMAQLDTESEGLVIVDLDNSRASQINI